MGKVHDKRDVVGMFLPSILCTPDLIVVESGPRFSIIVHYYYYYYCVHRQYAEQTATFSSLSLFSREEYSGESPLRHARFFIVRFAISACLEVFSLRSPFQHGYGLFILIFFFRLLCI